MFVLGNTVNGGIIGNTPNLTNFDSNENLLHEFDFRQIYSSLLSQHFRLDSDIINNALLNSYDSLDIISTSDNNLGDVNFDNQINVVDIVIMVNFILGLTIPTDEEFIAADVNEDGQLNVLDLIDNISNILNSSNNLTMPSIKKVGITQKNKTIMINKNKLIGGIEIHFDKDCNIVESFIDNDWVIRNYQNKVILYNPNLKSMKNDFSINFDKFSNINKIIISDKNGFAIKSRIYKK